MKRLTKRTLLFSLSLLSCGATYAQNNGFIGKKNYLSADVRLFTPVIYNLITRNETTNNKKIAGTTGFLESSNLITTGFNFALGRNISNKVAFVIQGSITDYKMRIGYDYYGSSSFIFDRATYIKGRAIGIMPILEISSKDGILPTGLSNQIGVGFYSHQPKESDEYLVLRNTNSGMPEYVEGEDLFNYDTYRIRSTSFMYKLNLRMPINRSLLFNIGLRYNLNFTKSSDNYSSASSENAQVSQRLFREMVRRTQVSNVMSLETGLTLAF